MNPMRRHGAAAPGTPFGNYESGPARPLKSMDGPEQAIVFPCCKGTKRRLRHSARTSVGRITVVPWI